jgi:hypothetical protein
MTPRPEAEHVAELALGPNTVAKLELSLAFDPWEALLAEMIAGDFGADRIDYCCEARCTPASPTVASTTIG